MTSGIAAEDSGVQRPFVSVLVGGRRCASARIPNLSPAIALEGDEFPEAALKFITAISSIMKTMQSKTTRTATMVNLSLTARQSGRCSIILFSVVRVYRQAHGCNSSGAISLRTLVDLKVRCNPRPGALLGRQNPIVRDLYFLADIRIVAVGSEPAELAPVDTGIKIRRGCAFEWLDNSAVCRVVEKGEGVTVRQAHRLTRCRAARYVSFDQT